MPVFGRSTKWQDFRHRAGACGAGLSGRQSGADRSAAMDPARFEVELGAVNVNKLREISVAG